jgi:hypothetical protein
VPVTEALGIGFPELERRFRTWLGAPAEVGAS